MRSILAILALTLGLAGCASQWVVDSDVRSYSEIATAPPAGAGYRFERLPSQAAHAPQQQALEAMAANALAGVGLHRDEVAPRYSALINARVTTKYPPWPDPWFGGGGGWWGPGFGYAGPWGYGPGWRGGGWYGGGWWGPVGPPPPNPWYAREVSIVLRELPSNRVVYETHARNTGPYGGNADILPVMFQAALAGFPNPPAGERRVNLPVETAKE